MRKIDNIQQLQYMANQELMTKLMQEWTTASPDNENLKAFQTAMLETIFYINKLEMDRESYGLAYTQLMHRKNKEIMELREQMDKLTNDIEL